jgi:hypothetical protein
VLESAVVFSEMFGGCSAPEGGGGGGRAGREGAGVGGGGGGGGGGVTLECLTGSARGAILRFHRCLLAALGQAASRRQHSSSYSTSASASSRQAPSALVLALARKILPKSRDLVQQVCV